MSESKLAVMGRPKKAEPSEPLRLPKSLARKIRRLAMHADIDPGDYVAREFGAATDKKHDKMLEELAKESGKKAAD